MADYRSLPRKTNDSTLARMRMAKGLTQEQLGALVGTTATSVGNWESGIRAPRINTLFKLAQIFDCSIDELLADKKPQ